MVAMAAEGAEADKGGDGNWYAAVPGLFVGALLPFALLFYGWCGAVYLLVPVLVLLIAGRLFTKRRWVPGGGDTGLITGPLSGALARTLAGILGLLYLAVPLSHLTLFDSLEHGRLWILFMLVIVWASDTGAYLVGRNFGSIKLCPSISPGKTVEGLAGGLLSSAIAAVLFYGFTPLTGSLGAGMPEAALLGIGVCVAAVLGDLLESALKRRAGVKDSGTLIPGHGGLLDRIDSLIPAVLVMYYYLLWQGL